MIAKLIALFAGRGLIIGSITAALVMTITWDRSRISSAVNRGVLEERARVIEKGADNARKADAARSAADRLPADRLRDKYCRDCR
jgi:acetolactate synthase small subunit